MNCPRCKYTGPLIAIERFDIEIDYCSQCRGVWLDRGELIKIIAKADFINSQKMVNADYIDEAIYEKAYNKVKDDFKNKRNKSFLEDLFS